MEWGCVLIGFDDLVFVVVSPTSYAFEIIGESMTANVDYSDLVHFSNKIIKNNTFAPYYRKQTKRSF